MLAPMRREFRKVIYLGVLISGFLAASLIGDGVRAFLPGGRFTFADALPVNLGVATRGRMFHG